MKKLLTKEGKIKIQEELNFLSTTEKTRVINELADARDRGGVDENTEYYIAKEEYDKLQAKISKLQETLNNSSVITSADITTDKVSILTTVKVLNVTNNKEMTFSIVPENEIDIKLGKISTGSPIGSGLMGRKVDEVCIIKTPAGSFEYKILDISI
jgi:transcription elongation factor GreA